MQNIKVKIQNYPRYAVGFGEANSFKLKILIALFFALFVFNFSFAEAAVLYAGSASENISEGQSFVVEWFVDTQNEALNLLSLQLNFSPDTLEVLEISRGSSILSLWLQEPTADQTAGTITFTAGAPGGFNDSNVPILRTTLLAKKAGRAQISMSESSVALRHDGKGTPASLNFAPLVFVIAANGSLPIDISSPSHPQQNKWSKENKAVIKFTPRPKEIYSYSFSKNVEIFPDNEPDGLKDEYVFENQADGIYYFRLSAQTGSQTWQEVGIYRLQIDRTAPEDFAPIISSERETVQGQKFMSFSTVDKTSGISHYEIETWPLVWEKIPSPYIISRPWVRSAFYLRAFDLAGNYREIRVPAESLLPSYLVGLIIVCLLGLGIVLKKQIWKRNKK